MRIKKWLLPVVPIVISLLLLGLALYCFYWPTWDGLDITGTQVGRDFINVWAGPRLAMNGEMPAPWDYEKYSALAAKLFGQAIPAVNWSYPPTTLLLYYPFSRPPYFMGLALWTVAGLAAALSVFRVYCAQNSWAVLGFLLSPAILINALSGQNGCFTAFLLLGGLLALRRYPIAAGIAFGILTFKPQLGIILPFALIALRAWRTIFTAVVTASVFIGISAAVFGINIWRQYFDGAVEVQLGFLYYFHGMYAFMMQSPFTAFRLIGMKYEAAFALQIVVTVYIVLHTTLMLRRISDPKRQALIVVSAVPLITPYIFNYDMVAIAIPLTCLLWSRGPMPKWRRLVYLFAWAFPLLGMLIGVSDYGYLRLFAPIAYAGVYLLACHSEKAGNIGDSGLESHNLA